MQQTANNYEAKFLAALADLNPEQRKAVETIDGPVMVIAGPGTGKTQILTLRIANILYRTDMQPENILALTFTDSGAKAMRERLRHYVGSLAYRVPIYTFHGFAQRLIAAYPDAFPRIIGGRPASDIEIVSLLETILDDTNFKLLRPLGNPTYYVPSLRSIISDLKQEYISPSDLLTQIKRQTDELAITEQYHQSGAHKGKVRGEYAKLEKQLAKNQELHAVYVRYEAAMREARWYDFNDMIIETVSALRSNEEMLRDLQETYQYVLADEHQDVNGAQNKILELLCHFHDQPNIFVVGDEKQAIYRFQGASLDNFLYFTSVFPATTTITLTTNYRSGQAILDFAQSLITVPDETLMEMRTPLVAATITKAAVEWRAFSHQAVEDDWLVSEVAAALASGESPREIAVIVRTNREVEALAVRLRQAGVPVAASADGDVLQHPIMQAIESLIQVVLVEKDEVALATVIQGAYWGLKTTDLVRIMSARSFEHPLVEILGSDALLASIGVSDVAAAKRILEVVTEARARQSYESPQRVLEYLLDASGFLQFVMTRDPFDGARVVRRVYDEIESLVLHDGVTSLSDIRRLITLRRSYHLPLTAPYITTSTDAVSVMTAHKAKGLEFAVVFVPHLIDKEWGGKVSRQMFAVSLHKYAAASDLDPDDDERRLLYVAFTRAKEKLYLSAAVSATQGKDLAVSRLMTPIVESGLISVRETSEIEATFSPVSALRGFNQPVSPVDTAVLRQLLLTRGLSATSLNNLLRNPWDFLFRNLLRLPEVKSTHLQFGTAIHAVLERTTRHHTKTGVWPAAAELLLWLGVELRRLPLTAVEYTRLHEKGSQHLVAYLTHLERTVTTATREEVSVRTAITVPTPEPIDLPLSGKLDRCDLDDSSYVLRVVDYKTGKPKTRSVIAGDTKASNGDYLRQLEFYVLLLSVQDDERLKTNQTVLSFVEPSAKGEIKEEIFVITDEAVVKLKETLTQAVVQFLAGDFLRDETTLAETAYPALARAWLERGV